MNILSSEKSIIVLSILFITEILIIPAIFFIINFIDFYKKRFQKYSTYNLCIQLIFNMMMFGFCSIPVLFLNSTFYTFCLVFAIWVILYSLFLFNLLRIYKKINDKPPFYLFYMINIIISAFLSIFAMLLFL